MRCGNGTHLLAALPILPLLVTQDCATALFGADALALLERLAEGTRTDLAVLVETVGSSENLVSEWYAQVLRNDIREYAAPLGHSEGKV